MSLASKVSDLAQRVGVEIKAVRSEMNGAKNVFVQPTAPSPTPSGPYMWVQTGLGPGGHDVTFWIEDGIP